LTRKAKPIYCSIKKEFEIAKTKEQSHIRFKRHEPIGDIAKDLLGFKDLVPQFVKDLQNTKPPYVIGLTGEWGIGKTSFLELLKREAEGLEVVGRIELWKFSGRVDLSAVLVSEIADHFGLANSKTSKKLLKTLLALPSSASVRAGPVSLDVGKLVKEVCKIWKSSKDKVHTEFEKLVRRGLESRGEKEGIRMLVLLDDLDRCLPDQALDLLEKLRLFFDSDKVIFIVALDEEVVADAITARFGKDVNIDGRWYLEKLIDKMYRLPLPPPEQFQAFIKARYKTFIQEEIPEELKGVINTCWSQLLDSRTLGNPRRVLRALERMITLLNRVEDGHKSSVFLGFPLLLLREIYPELYSLAKRDAEVITILGGKRRKNPEMLSPRYRDRVQKLLSNEAIRGICEAVCVAISSSLETIEKNIKIIANLFDRFG